MFDTDTWLKILCGIVVNAVVFGVGAISVLSVPALAAQAKYAIPIVVVFSFAVTPLLAIWIAPRLRLQTWGRKGWQRGDVISG